MSKSNHERRMRYSIRKFSVGVASVAVASLFMGSVVHATENVSANPPIPQIVSPGDKKEYEDAVQRVNKEISDYVTSRLDSLDRSVSGFSEIVTKVQVVVDKYRDKIDRVSTKSMVEELGREVKKKVDEEIKLFQNRSGSKSTPKGLSLNDGLQGGGDPSVGQGLESYPNQEDKQAVQWLYHR
ncbi:choline binding protein A [Streptococcus pneumoniae]|nr:choline binding protein A [Streptococcus pneumoniae]